MALSEKEELELLSLKRQRAMSGKKQGNTPTDWKGVVGSAVKSATMQPGTVPNKLMVPSLANAPSQAKALPFLASTAGGLMGGPMGMTKFGEGGRALSDAALASYGMKDQIPSVGSHALELGGNVLGDVIALPSIKKGIYGRQIGKVEKAAGVPDPYKNPEMYPSLPRPSGPAPVTNSIDDAVKMINDPTVEKTPVFWKRLKDQIQWFYDQGKVQKLSGLDKIKIASLSNAAEKGLNASVKGRGIPAAALAESQVVPNAINKGIRMLPPRMQAGAQFGTGMAGPLGGTALLYEIVKKLIGQ